MEHLLGIANDFCACTHLITRAFDRFGRCLGIAVGEGAGIACSAQWQDAVSAALDDLSADDEKGYALVSAPEEGVGDIWFIVCYADPVAPELGSFAIGPFASRGASRYPRKPLSAVPHLVGLLRDIAKDALLPSADTDRQQSPLQRALEAIHRAFPSPISMDDICREVGISKPGLCRVFRREMGITFCGYVHRLRVERGKLLLRDQSYSILDVALAAGFCDQSYFNRIFKRETGQTPRRYRNALQSARAVGN